MMSDIPLVDLRAQYHAIKPEIDQAIQRVLDSGQFVLGPEVSALEHEMAAYCGTTQAVAVASGTDALELSLRACGIGHGDEVITTAYSFMATAEAIVAVGARPIFVDIDPLTYTLDPSLIEAALTSKTTAILPVHLYGHPCAMDELMRVAERHRLLVIEDCAQAIGAEYRRRKVGSFGRAGCLSFYPSKNLGAYGDGGMVVTSDQRLAEQLRLLRAHGSPERYHHLVLGANSRLDELQAAILRVKLRHLEDWTEARRRHAHAYRTLMAREHLAGLIPPQERADCRHVYHLFVVRAAQRDALAQTLFQQGIGVQVTYPATLPQQPALASLGYRTGQFPEAERAAAEVLSLPLYPELTPALIEQVVRCLSIQKVDRHPKLC